MCLQVFCLSFFKKYVIIVFIIICFEMESLMNDNYQSPFNSRYASKEMQFVFSNDNKFKTWRKLWIALAKAEAENGLPITQEQIDELQANVDNINYEVANEKEKLVRHDVMAHVYAYGVQCPKAAGIIHLGATSCYVGDNTDIIVMRDAMLIIRRKLINVIALLSKFALEYKNLPTLGYTHLQPAQLTTVGKRATLWINEFLIDLKELDFRIASLKLLGSKGTTGTQASFVELFEGDSKKISSVENQIAREMGFNGVVPVSGQTYSRKIDTGILSTLSGIAASASKFSNDMRLLQNFKEMEEPFEKNQIGSSAMPYKRNPMRSERITALARFVISITLNPAFTSATQWFERTLDDSANKRLSVAEGFLATDSILGIMLNVCDGLVVYPKVIEMRVMKELPFMATENIMMSAVKKGGNRQELHEKLRQHSIAAANVVKQQGLENDLIERICADSTFNLSIEEINSILKPSNFVGRAPEQVDEFITTYIAPILKSNADILGEKIELVV
jgi:adenylosuccinate lyase